MTDDGLKRLAGTSRKRAPVKVLAEDYASFCSAAEQLMADFDVPPELVDYFLAAAGGAGPRTDLPLPPSSSGIWLFQANPSIYDIDSALSEMRRDRLGRCASIPNTRKKGDRVYLWRSGA